ncbi:reverse transcriptase domain-containing protein [Tanacetum coccineum]
MPRECLRIIESKSKVRNSRNKPVVAKVGTSTSTPSFSSDVVALTTDVAELKDMMKTLILDKQKSQAPATVNHPLAYQAPAYQAPAPQTQDVQYNTKIANFNAASTLGSGSGFVPSNTVANLKGELKAITTRSGASYDGPQVPPPTSSLPKVVENKPEPNSKPLIPYPSRRNDERRREKANDQIEKFYEIFKDLSFEISLTDALILMPKFASTLKALIRNKEKLSEMARTPLNEHCSAVILNKLPKKLRDPGKFLIPCDFPRMDKCLALADLGASINITPLSVWKKLSLPVLTPTCMTLELADRSISQPISIAEDVNVKVGKFQFSADFVVVDFDA